MVALCLSEAFLSFWSLLYFSTYFFFFFFGLRIILDVQKSFKDKTESSHTLFPILYVHRKFPLVVNNLYHSGNFVPVKNQILVHFY